MQKGFTVTVPNSIKDNYVIEETEELKEYFEKGYIVKSVTTMDKNNEVSFFVVLEYNEGLFMYQAKEFA